MKLKILFLLILLVVIGALLASGGFDFAPAVVPGWHTTIIPPFFFAGILWCWFLLVVVVYLLFLKKNTKPKHKNIYLILTLPCPMLITIIQALGLMLEGERQLLIFRLMPALLVTILPFLVAQLWFLVVLTKAILSQSKSNN